MMRAVVQRVASARVVVGDGVPGQIGRGLLVLVGVTHEDTVADARVLANKVAGLRIFEDQDGRMNLAAADVSGALLVVSQFTLYGDCRKGRRPSFDAAARPEQAEALYDAFVAEARTMGLPVHTGVFQAHMMVELVNDGPVTLVLDTAM